MLFFCYGITCYGITDHCILKFIKNTPKHNIQSYISWHSLPRYNCIIQSNAEDHKMVLQGNMVV